ncbi:MAG: efflux transporter periplasmic adaptor subunit [Acidocella sp. 20-63-7]|nr:MAG: efflux transporter periplasmic adaptor subunit [Acidocella sp. 20-63-7]HQT45708.1 efflux RND transporter periplasmic adaptor subunit [Acidocella sp.]
MSMARTTTLRMIVMLVAVGIVFGGVFGYGALRSYFIAKFLAGFANQTQTVSTTVAVTTPWQPKLDAVGSLVAVNGAELSAEVGGIVDAIHFQSGANVPAGALLLTLRSNNDPAVLAQLQATAALDQLNYERDRKQLKADAVSQSQVDTDRATLAAAQAQVQAQQALMAEKQIRAPFAGRLGIRQVDVGQYLSVGTPIVSLQQLNPLYVDFYLPQQSLSQLTLGQNVLVTLDAFPGQKFAAKLSAIDAAVDSATRNVQVRATLTNDKLALRPGMFANVSLGVGAVQDLVTLPQTAITYNPYGSTVFLVKHGTDQAGKSDLVAQQVFVTTGDTRGDQVAVLSGVKPGDEVITAGQLKLRNGTLLVINNSVHPTNNPNPNPPNE